LRDVAGIGTSRPLTTEATEGTPRQIKPQDVLTRRNTKEQKEIAEIAVIAGGRNQKLNVNADLAPGLGAWLFWLKLNA
jgi:hypothetical protein